MKEYKKPTVEVFELRQAEEIAAVNKVEYNGALISLFDLGNGATSN